MIKLVDLTKLPDNELEKYAYYMRRAETDYSPIVYIKGIRAALMAVGYPEEFIEGKFRNILDKVLK